MVTRRDVDESERKVHRPSNRLENLDFVVGVLEEIEKLLGQKSFKSEVALGPT